MRTQLTEIKWLLVILDRKERFFSYTFGLFHGMQQTDGYYNVKPIIKLRCHVDLLASDFRYVIQKNFFWGGGGRVYLGKRVYSAEYGISPQLTSINVISVRNV